MVALAAVFRVRVLGVLVGLFKNVPLSPGQAVPLLAVAARQAGMSECPQSRVF